MVTASDRVNVSTNSGIVNRLAGYLCEHGRSPGNAPLTNAAWLQMRQDQPNPDGCSENELLVSLKAMLDEIQPA